MNEIIVNVVTAVCFVLLTLSVFYVVISFAKKDREGRIAFIRSFKKGKCLIVLLIAIPLSFIGNIDKGLSFFDSLFNSIAHMAELVFLKFGLDKVKGLADKNVFYRFTMYYLCTLVIINALLFAISLFSQRLWQFESNCKFKFSKKEKFYIFGYNKNSVDIYKSCKGKNCVIVDNVDEKSAFRMYVEKINHIQMGNSDGLIDGIIKSVSKKNIKNTVIINYTDDEKSLEFTRKFSQKICSYVDSLEKDLDSDFQSQFDMAASEKDKKAVKTKLEKAKTLSKDKLLGALNVYVFCDPRFDAICNSIVENSRGCVHYKNKYQMIAANFIERYPLSAFMDGRHLDYASATVKDGVDINVCMIGFGNTGREIFLTSVANNQFLQKSNNADGVELKQVNYYVFDKEPADNNKNLNHSYYRYRNECLAIADEDKYLPLPKLPANEEYYRLDVNDSEFYNKIRGAIGKKGDANFVIIAFGSDLENIDMGYKLVEKRKEWESADDAVIFVKARRSYKDCALFSEPNVILIGNEKTDVYNIGEITNDSIFRMAQMRNLTYHVEYEVSQNDGQLDSQNLELWRSQSNVKWYVDMSQTERDSSLFCALSLRSKLNLIGLDYRKALSDGKALTYDEYMDIYADGDKPSFYNLPAIDGRKIVDYPLDFNKSLRTNLAILEHLRWNSYMISKGMIPSTKEQILNEKRPNGKFTNGKNYNCRRHGNLTTFEGLVDFRQMVAQRDGADEASKDVIKYDYQIMDDAYWLLDKNGYEIIKREN